MLKSVFNSLIGKYEQKTRRKKKKKKFLDVGWFRKINQKCSEK